MGMDLDAEAVRDVENNINTARWAVRASLHQIMRSALITTDLTRLTGRHPHSTENCGFRLNTSL